MAKGKNSSTRRLLNLNTISNLSIKGFNKQELVYYAVTPFNLSVLSDENIDAKVFSLMNVIKGFNEIEILCLNSRENFGNNKLHIKGRIAEESNHVIRHLLQMDLDHIDEIQLTTATARSFLLCVRIHENNNHELHSYLNRIEKSLKTSGFSVKRLSKDELKTMLAVYYEQNVTTDKFEDIDGERWYNTYA